MGYFIGIDGGGTKTLLKAADQNGTLIAQCQGGPSNIYGTDISTVEDNLRQLIDQALRQSGISMRDIECICLGTAGAGRDKEKELLRNVLTGIGIPCRIIITDDAVTALYGALGKGEGIILISGTGSICYGRNAGGTMHRVGGWGHIIGDEGSGYDIGRRILAEVMKSYDGRSENTTLTEAVLDELKIKSPEELIQYVYRGSKDKGSIAALSRLLDPACEAGYSTAVKIAQDAAYELFLCIKAVIDRLWPAKPGNSSKFDSKADINLVMMGSVLEKGIHVKKELTAMIKNAYPSVCIKEPLNDAAWGAVLIAMEGIDND